MNMHLLPLEPAGARPRSQHSNWDDLHSHRLVFLTESVPSAPHTPQPPLAPHSLHQSRAGQRLVDPCPPTAHSTEHGLSFTGCGTRARAQGPCGCGLRFHCHLQHGDSIMYSHLFLVSVPDPISASKTVLLHIASKLVLFLGRKSTFPEQPGYQIIQKPHKKYVRATPNG